MGTSSDYKGGTGGNWTPFKIGTSAWIRRGGGEEGAQAVVARFVRALGGTETVIQATPRGRSAARNFAAFLASAGQVGLTRALEEWQFSDLAGRPASDVLANLATRLAGPGDTLDGQAALAATLDVLVEMCGSDLDDLGPLEHVGLEQLPSIVGRWLAAYVYHRLKSAIAEKLRRLDPDGQMRLDGELRAMITAIAARAVTQLDVPTAGWRSDQLAGTIDDVFRRTFAVLEAL